MQKLVFIEEEYIAQLSSPEKRKAVVMIDEITELVDKIIDQDEFINQQHKKRLSRTQFNKLLKVLKNSQNFARQKNLLLMTSLHKKFTVNQVYRLLHCISDLDNKFTILELLVPNISNPKEMYRLFEYVKNLGENENNE